MEIPWWPLARASGIVAWALLTATVVWGLALSTRVLGKRPPPPWLADLHQHLGGLASVATVLHLAALVGDDVVEVRIVDLLVPFASRWRPGAVAWGVVALWLLAAVQGTSVLRKHVPARWWRRVHATSAVLWLAATVHLALAGTDADAAPLRTAALGSIALVTFLLLVRLLAPRTRRAPSVRANET